LLKSSFLLDFTGHSSRDSLHFEGMEEKGQVFFWHKTSHLTFIKGDLYLGHMEYFPSIWIP